MVNEILVSEPVAGVSLAELATRLTAAVEMDPGVRVVDGQVRSGWPDTGRFLESDPEYDRLKSVDGIARACYVFHHRTAMGELAVYFERRDGELRHIESYYSEHYREAIEEVRDTYGMHIDEDILL